LIEESKRRLHDGEIHGLATLKKSFSIKDCGLVLDFTSNRTTEDIIEWAISTEKSGYGYVFRADHISSRETDSREERPECWVILGAIAASTRKIKFGPLVTPIGFRNPALLARMACTLHSYSAGRLILSVGAGWLEEEYKAHGMSFPGVKTRIKQLHEALQIIRPLTQGRRVDFNGEFFSAHVEIFPKPFHGNIHMIGGGSSSQVIRTLIGYVDEWNLFYSPMDKYLKLKGMFSQEDSDSLKMSDSYMASFILAESEAELQKKIKWYGSLVGIGGSIENIRSVINSRGIFCGKVEDFVQQVNNRRCAGVEKLYFQVLNSDDMEMKNLLTETLKKEF
jgi:alkanesulfonate monooxygenase SsuD/methylene tetrahydromethanopterin reductase-like flavin-dependent oxidoreductase (luciferase family)